MTKELPIDPTSLRSELIHLASEERRLKQDLAKLSNRRSEVQQALNAHGTVLHVTDHAMLRYIERGMGVDLQHVRLAILGPDSRQLHIKLLRDCTIPIGGGLRIVCKDGAVVTVVPDE